MFDESIERALGSGTKVDDFKELDIEDTPIFDRGQLCQHRDYAP